MRWPWRTTCRVTSLDIWDDFHTWCNAHVDFLHESYNAQSCVSLMHGVSLMILNAQKKFCTKPKLAAIIMQALKACAAPSVLHVHHALAVGRR